MADPEDMEARQALQHTALIASTFANQELASIKKSYQQITAQHAKLETENVHIREEMLERDRDALQVVEFLRREVEKKQDLIEQTLKQVDDVSEVAEKRLQQEVSRLMFVVKEKEDSLDKAEDDIRRLEDEIESIAEFKRQKHELTQELAMMRRQLHETKEKYERELSRANFAALEERVRLKGEKKEFVEKFNAEVNGKAMSMLDEKTRMICEQNKALVDEKKVLETEVHHLTSRLTEVSGHLTTKTRGLELATQSHELIGKQGYRLRKEVQQLSHRNVSLEDTVRSVAERYELEIHKSKTAHETQVLALSDTVQSLRNAVDTRTREVRKLRGLARDIVSQRTDLETFFYEALSYVKDKKGSETLPAITPPVPSRDVEARVDIAQLSWDDKERVLRILFAKINASGNRTPAPPPQPLSLASSMASIGKSQIGTGQQGNAFFITESPHPQRDPF